MKKLIPLILLACTIFFIMSCKVGYISQSKAKHRQKRYEDVKKENFEALSKVGEIDSVRYTKDNFEKVLTNLTAGGYDGFRFYFATYPNKVTPTPSQDSGYNYLYRDLSDCFAFIFVPTKEDPADKTKHIDDQEKCWIVYSDLSDNQEKPQSFDARANGTFLSTWVNKYRQKRLPGFEKDGNEYVNNGFFKIFHKHKVFEETWTVWYSRKKTEALLKFIGDNSKKQVEFVDVYVSAYLLKHSKWSYQLTPIFGIVYQNKNSKNELVGEPKTEFITFKGSYSANKGGDTGVPCPPPACSGTALPQ